METILIIFSQVIGVVAIIIIVVIALFLLLLGIIVVSIMFMGGDGMSEAEWQALRKQSEREEERRKARVLAEEIVKAQKRNG